MLWTRKCVISKFQGRTLSNTSNFLLIQFSSLQSSCSGVSNSLQPHDSQHARPPCLSPTRRVLSNSCPSSRWCHPTISSSVPSPPAFSLSQNQGLFQWVSSSHQVAKVSFSLSISPSNEYSGLISFRMDWLDILANQGTLKSLLQHHSSKASIFWCSAFFKIWLSQSVHDDWKSCSFD